MRARSILPDSADPGNAARAYAAAGIPVFPCRPDKRPFTPNGFKAATTDEATIRQWWQWWPAALIGIPTGEASGIWVLDIDAPGEHAHDGFAALAALEAEHGPLPRTRTHATASGGRHLLFRFDPEQPVTNAPGRMPKGIDIRGRGGYIIAPPSRRAAGAEWRVEDAAAIAEAPEWLLAMLRRPEWQPPPQGATAAPRGTTAARSGRTPRKSGGLYANVNSASLESIMAWAPVLFPRGRYQQGTGAWRVRSADLGEPWQEDLSIAPDGVMHFGEERPFTPIDLVAKYGGHRNAKQAALWLCERLGLDPETMRRPVVDDLPATYPRATMTAAEARSALQAQMDGFLDRVMAHLTGAEAGAEPPMLAIGVGVGLGKTRAARRLIAKMVRSGILGDRKIVYLVPRHALGAEIVEAFAEMGIRAAQWRGRDRDDPLAPGETMCRDLDRVIVALEAEEKVEQAACRRKRKDGTLLQCPHFSACGFQRQKAEVAGAQVIVAAHDSMFAEKPAAIGEIAAVIIDEGFHTAGLRGVDGKPTTVPLAGMAGHAICFDYSGEVDIDATQELNTTRAKLWRALTAIEGGPIPISALRATCLSATECRRAAAHEHRRMRKANMHPGMSAAERKAALAKALPPDAHKGEKAYAKPGRAAALWEILARALEGNHDAAGAEIGQVQVEGGSYAGIYLRWRANIRDGWRGPLLHIDATMQPELVRQYLPGIEIAEPVQARTPHMRIRQILGAPVTAKALLPREGASEKERQTAENHLRRLHAFIGLRAMAVRPGKALVVAQLAVVEKLKEMGLPANVETAHLNGLSGSDRWRDVRAMVVIGRTLPEPGAVERLAVALTGRQPEPIPLEPGQRWAWYPDAERRIAMADGGSVPISSEQHPDPVVEALRWRITEGELIQAIGRGRGVNRTSADPLEVELLADHCLPLEVAEVAAWEDEMPDRWAEMAARGAVLITASHRARAHPDLWETVRAADRDPAGADMPKRLLESLCNKQKGITAPWAKVAYQLAGERQRPAEAWFDRAQVPDPRAWLEQKLGPLAAFAAEPAAPVAAEIAAAPAPDPLPPEPAPPVASAERPGAIRAGKVVWLAPVVAERSADPPRPEPPPSEPVPPACAIDHEATELMRRHAARLGIAPERVVVLTEGQYAPPRPPTALPMHIAQQRARLYEAGRLMGLPAWRLRLDLPAEAGQARPADAAEVRL